MRLFGSSTTNLSDEIFVDILDEQAFYTSGDHVRGQVLVSPKYWQSVSLETVLVCEESAEHNPFEVETPRSRFRRSTIAGETLEGELLVGDDGQKYGVFPFDLRIHDDTQARTLLPSFEMDSGELNLSNAIRWVAEARMCYKGREARDTREIVIIPTRPTLLTDVLRLTRSSIDVRAYKPQMLKNGAPKQLPSFYTASVSGLLSVPESELRQYPETVPIGLKLDLTGGAGLISVTTIKVELITVVSAQINGETSVFTVPETLHKAELSIDLDDGETDLSSQVSGVIIENTCPDFCGKWLKVQHRLQVHVGFQCTQKPTYRQTLTLCADIVVKTPASSEGLIDAPPQYTPPPESSLEVIRSSSILPINPALCESQVPTIFNSALIHPGSHRLLELTN